MGSNEPIEPTNTRALIDQHQFPVQFYQVRNRLKKEELFQSFQLKKIKRTLSQIEVFYCKIFVTQSPASLLLFSLEDTL